jgi:predicted lipoprotein with Yx(FWY)xxD motif
LGGTAWRVRGCPAHGDEPVAYLISVTAADADPALTSSANRPVPWAGSLTTTKVAGKTVLAAQQLTGAGWVNFPVYTFSADSPSSSACAASVACARAWPPVITSGGPGWTGVPSGQIGGLGIPGNLQQVSWAGQPLYLFSHEQLARGPGGVPVTSGNGNGIKAFGGTFSLVVNP